MTTWVLLRGLGREARHWGDFRLALQRRLPLDHAVIALDLPGNGEFARERSPATVRQIVEASQRRLDTLPQRAPYVFVALSLGGMVALDWAMADPGRVAGCVLINSSLGGFSPFWHRLRPSSYAALLQLIVLKPRAGLRERRILELTSNLPVADETAQAWTRYAQLAPPARGNVLRQLLAASRFRAPGAAPRVPVLLLASERDRLVSVRCSQAIARAWKVPLALHPSAGHDLPLDDPQWLVEQLVAWEAVRGHDPRKLRRPGEP